MGTGHCFCWWLCFWFCFSRDMIVYQFQLLTFTNVSCSILSLAPLSMESCVAEVNRSHWYLPSGEICEAFEIGVVGLRTVGFAKQLIPARTTRSAQPWRGYSTGSFIRPCFFWRGPPSMVSKIQDGSLARLCIHCAAQKEGCDTEMPASSIQEPVSKLSLRASQSQMCRWKRPFCGLVPCSFQWKLSLSPAWAP